MSADRKGEAVCFLLLTLLNRAAISGTDKVIAVRGFIRALQDYGSSDPLFVNSALQIDRLDCRQEGSIKWRRRLNSIRGISALRRPISPDFQVSSRVTNRMSVCYLSRSTAPFSFCF